MVIPSFDKVAPRAGSNLETIMTAVINETGISEDKMKGIDKHRMVVEARQMAMKLIRYYEPKFTLKKIGEFFNRDHSTVIYAIDTANDLIKYDRTYRQKFNAINCQLRKMERATA